MRRRSRTGSASVKSRRRKAATPKRRSAPTVRAESESERLRRERDEALEQQRATAEVLKIISTSPTELQPVLEVVVESAARFCDAVDVSIFELDGQHLRITAAHWGAVPQDVGARFLCVRGHVSGRAVLDRKPVHVTDLHAEAEEFPEGSAFARRLGFRTTAAVPLLREGVAIGAIVLRRAEVNPFTNKQIALLETFAAQAVIAIENTRLLNELRDSLQRQTATADVLKVISSSPGDLKPVFQAMLENATRICEAKFGTLYLREGDGLRAVALHGAPLAYAEERQRQPVIYPGRTTLLGQAVATKRTGQIADIQDEADYAVASGRTGAQLAKLGGARTVVAVPMVREDEPVGAILIYRQEVRPFSDKQVELLTNFANRSSSRRPRRKCCALSVRHPASWSLFSRIFSTMRPAFVRLISASWLSTTGALSS